MLPTMAATEPGPLALVGSGAYLPSMLDVERALIDGRPPRYVQIPTAAAPEGAARLRYWVDLGRAQADRLGVEAVPLVITDRAEADDPAVAGQIEGAGLIYLSGGSPTVLSDILRDTRTWQAIVDAWRQGAALAGRARSAGPAAVPDASGRHTGRRRRGNGTRRWPGGVHRDRPSVGLGARGRQARRLSVGDTLTLT
jgi:peptidase E